MCRAEASVTVRCLLISDAPSPVSLFRHQTIRKIGQRLVTLSSVWTQMEVSSPALQLSWHPSLWFNTPEVWRIEYFYLMKYFSGTKARGECRENCFLIRL